MPVSEAQLKAVAKYKKNNYSRIPLDVPKEYHEYIKMRAKQDGQTVNAWIKQAMEQRANNTNGEIPQEVISKSMEWLKDHNHTDTEIVDFLKHISE